MSQLPPTVPPTALPQPNGNGEVRGPALAKLTLLPLIAATYFMVAGGPYGLEELVKNAGYTLAIAILIATPILWSLPTALMVSELSSAVPEEGGYYAWVRRALGPFWGFQEAWLSMAASIFDMAIYPVMFVKYFASLCGNPELEKGWPLYLIGGAVIAACAITNIIGARAVGGSALVMITAMLGPFVVLIGCAVFWPAVPAEQPAEPAKIDWMAGLCAAMWNYMGWDNAATIAGEVDRPQRTYPLAMCGAVLLVMFTYLLPVLAASQSGIDAAKWKTGTWVDVGTALGGLVLGSAIALGGMVAALGTFNSLVLSYSRIPVVLARDGYLPNVFTRLHPRTGAPWVSILVCAVAWGLALQFSLPRLFALDVILYGLSLILEFVALLALRLREPELARPFRVPGGLFGAALLPIGPALLIGLAIYGESGKWEPEEDDDLMSPGQALIIGAILAALGPVVYCAATTLRRWAKSDERSN